MSQDVVVTSPGRPAYVFSVPQEQLCKLGSCAPSRSCVSAGFAAQGKRVTNSELRVPSVGGEDSELAGGDPAVRHVLVPGEPGLRARSSWSRSRLRAVRRDGHSPASPFPVAAWISMAA